MVTPHPPQERSAAKVYVVVLFARRSVVLLTLGLTVYVLTWGRLERHQHKTRARTRAVGVQEIAEANAEPKEIRFLARTSAGGNELEQIRQSYDVTRQGLFSQVNPTPHLRVDTGIPGSEQPNSMRIISLVVPLFEAKSDLSLQLSYLAHAFERKLLMESVLHTVEIQLALETSRSSCTDFLQLFPDTARRLVWFDDLDAASYLETYFKQESWLKKRYPHDDDASTDSTLSVDAASSSLSRAASWRQTAHHLQALLLQQSREPQWQQRLGAQISLPFLVSHDVLENVQDFKALEFLPMDGAACKRSPSVTVGPDETVVFFRQVEHAQDFPLQFPATQRVLVLYDSESFHYLHSYRARLESVGHTVRMEELQSQKQAFCLGRYASHFLDTSPSKLGEWVQIIAARASSASQNKPFQQAHLRRLRRTLRSST